MPRTSTVVKFGLYAMSIKSDGALTSSDLQPFTKLDDLKSNSIQSTLYATYEKNYWLLNGNYKFVPTVTDKIHIGIISDEMSDANGDFTIPPVLTVIVPKLYTVNGLTLRFAPSSNDYASSINVKYYDEFDALIRSDNYTPTEYDFSTLQSATDFIKIVITFNATNKPYRYLRLSSIDYGDLITFEGAEIKSASVVEQINPISIELPVNALELSLFSNNSAFDITNPVGDYFDLQNQQPLDVYENIGNSRLYIGQFYLSEWENKSDTEIMFKAVDMVGVLDSYPFYGGLYNAVTAADLLFAMMDAIKIPYSLDPELESVLITGWIPVCSYRAALQQIAFVIGGYVTCSRSNLVQIRKTELVADVISFDETITKAQKGAQQSLMIKPLVTGVEVSSHTYSENVSVIELYNGILAAGNHTITFNEPTHDLSISGATIVSSGANYAVVNVVTPGTVNLSGEKYTDAIQLHGVYNVTLDTSVKNNILKIPNVFLISTSNAQAIAQRVYDYYQQRYWQKIKLFAPTVEVGNSALIDTLNNKQVSGIIEKMSINLSGGFTAQVETTGIIEV